MSEQNQPEVGSEAGQVSGGWRYWLGMTLLVLSFILPVLALVLVPLFGFPEAVNSVLYALSLAGGPDLLLVLAVGAMGKENIDRILDRVVPWLKNLLHWDRVTRTRYVVGLWVLALSVVLPFIVTVFFEDSVVTAGNDPGWGYYVVVGSYFGFLAAFFVCGGQLWDRVRAIFTWDARVTFPSAGQDASGEEYVAQEAREAVGNVQAAPED